MSSHDDRTKIFAPAGGKNATLFNPKVHKGMKEQLDKQECIFLELEDNLDTLRANLGEMGVEVA